MNERIGPYVVDSRIGVGGMGVVYAAHDEALDRKVAIKVISPQLADDAEFRERFVREARAMASLSSSHVVQVYAHGETAGQLWIATQLVPDGDLGTLLRRAGAPTLPVALDLIAQVAEGLADAHDAGLIHRDIKPANVLLRRNGSTYAAYLADFGIARRAGGDYTGLTQGVVGTPSYMAPELHRGATAGVPTDIYSLGCLLWSTLVGHAPFAGTSDYEIASAHLDQPVPQLDGDGPGIAEVNRVLRTAMAKEPSERYADARRLRDELRRIQRQVEEAPTVARAATPAGGASAAAARPAAARPAAVGAGAAATPDWSAGSGAPPRRRTGLLLGAAAALLALALGGIAWIALDSADPEDRGAGAETAGSTDSAESPSDSPTESLTDSPSDTASDTPTGSPGEGSSRSVDPGDLTSTQRSAAKESYVAALMTQPMIGAEQAECIATSVIDELGLPLMIERGFFDAEMTYVDQDLADNPEMKSALDGAVLTCIATG